MGQQQLLLIVLGVIIVGIAVAVGISMFNDSAIQANRDALTNDLVNLAARAQMYYRRPLALGGGGNDFTKLTIANLTNSSTNANGSYKVAAVTNSQVTLEAYGTEEFNSLPVQIECLVWPSRDSIIVKN